MLTWSQARGSHLPGGKVEPGESPEEAAVREVFEECRALVRRPTLLLGGTSIRREERVWRVDYYLAQFVGSVAPTTRWGTLDEVGEWDRLNPRVPLVWSMAMQLESLRNLGGW